jgi:predicted enzyme related to lactoylglutathione lyase
MGVKVGKVILRVADVDAAVADFRTLFGLDFVLFDAPGHGVRCAWSDAGVEFLQSTNGAPMPAGKGPLSSLGLAVPDVEAARTRVLAAGRKIVAEIPLESGRNEYIVEPLHGVQVALVQECGHFDRGLGTVDR